jgi:O-antigen/teichoic acid export membrane protein
MMIYSLPLMVAGLPGIINESLDRILFRFFVGPEWRADLGVYQAAVKLAVIMNLFIQMFRYAAEPFFFARDKEKGSKELYARVMEYFVAFCIFIFLGVTLYMDVLGLILGKNFRGALGTVPIMLLAYMMLGILFNVSMWYKLSGQTKYAVTITVLGLAVTAIVNIIFMPRFSYWASVCAHFLSCLTMLIYSAWLGNKYYPIPYKWRKICGYVGVGVVIYGISMLIAFGLGKTGLGHIPEILVKLGLNTILIVIYLAYVQHKTKLLKYKWAQI